jgi:hypothetical protein
MSKIRIFVTTTQYVDEITKRLGDHNISAQIDEIFDENVEYDYIFNQNNITDEIVQEIKETYELKCAEKRVNRKLELLAASYTNLREVFCLS